MGEVYGDMAGDVGYADDESGGIRVNSCQDYIFDGCWCHCGE